MEKTLVLFHANWCPYCVNYMKEWNEIKELLESNNIKTLEYEESTNQNIIKKYEISKFPTLIYFDENNNKNKLKNRNIDYIKEYFNINKLNNDNDKYKKYLKYKSKYLNLKNE